jgi:hypothetical protein
MNYWPDYIVSLTGEAAPSICQVVTSGKLVSQRVKRHPCVVFL